MRSSEATVAVHFHGSLRKLFPEPVHMSGCNVSEILNGICRQTKKLNPVPGKPRHCVTVVGYETEEALTRPLNSDVKELHITPAMFGGKSGGFFKVIIGVVIVAAVIATGGVSLAGGSLAFSSMWSQIAFNFGVSLILGGLLEMLSPAPRIDMSGDTENDPEASKYLGATQNTVKIGTRIPLLFGEHIAYGHYLSFDVDAVDVAVAA